MSHLLFHFLIKVGPMENPFRRKCVTPVHLELLTDASYLKLRARKKKDARSEQDNRTRFAEYKQTHTDHHECADEHESALSKLCGHFIQMIYMPSCQQCMLSTHTQTNTHSLLHRLFPPAARWLVIGKLTGQHSALCFCFFCGETWQVEIGKMESPLFSPVGWTKDQTFLSPPRK